MTIIELSSKTVSLIKSSQVITSLSSVLKELIENALDAGATIISIKLDNYGFNKLEVKDNGSGIKEEDAPLIAQPHFTSKITCFNDLECLSSYGFRGEALSSLCAVADVTLTSKTKQDEYGYSYTLDNNGNIKHKKPAAVTMGTTVTVQNLFKNVPVRRQFYFNSKRRKDELRKIESLVQLFAIVHPQLHISLFHDKNVIFQKPAAPEVKIAIRSVFRDITKNLLYRECEAENVILRLWLPRSVSSCCSASSSEKLFLSVNGRPLYHKPIEKLVKVYFSQKTEGVHGRYPVGVILITVPPDQVDVNLEPNKTRVFFREEKQVLENLEKLLRDIYGEVSSVQNTESSTDLEESIPCTLVPSAHSESACNPSDFASQGDHHSDKSLATSEKREIDETPLTPPLNTANAQDNGVTPTKTLPLKPNVSSDLTLVPELSSNTGKECNGTSPELDDGSGSTTNNVHQRDIPESVVLCLPKTTIGEQISIPTTSSELTSLDPRNFLPQKIQTPSVVRIPNAADEKSANQNGSQFKAAWSRGHIYDRDSVNIQTVQILQPPSTGKLETSSEELGLKRKESEKGIFGATKCQNKRFKLTSMNASVASTASTASPSPLQKAETPFSLFTKSIRKQVIEETPGVDFTVIAKEIAKRWNNTDAATKRMFEEKVAETKGIKLKKFSFNSSLVSPSPIVRDDIKNTPNSGLFPRTSTPCNNSKEVKANVLNVAKPWHGRTLTIEVDVEKLRGRINAKKLKPLSSDLIGSLKGINGWIYRFGDSICTLNASRMNEIILFKTLIQSFAVPSVKLEESIHLNVGTLGKQNWETLLKLDNKPSYTINEDVITDSRITSNGFKITLLKDSDGVTVREGELTHIPESIPNSGLEDLRKIFGKLHHAPNSSLEESRPPVLRTWFKEQSLRMARGSPHIREASVLMEKVNLWNRACPQQEAIDVVCLHGNNIFNVLVSLKNL